MASDYMKCHLDGCPLPAEVSHTHGTDPVVRNDEAGDRGEMGMPTLGFGAGSLLTTMKDALIGEEPNQERALRTSHVNRSYDEQIDLAKPVFTVTPEGDMLVQFPHGMSDQARRICYDIMPAALSLFVSKNRGYGNTAYNLGARGQYADMNRKFGKLKHTLWDGNEAIGEDVVEMLEDLFGHVLLTIDYVVNGEQQ